MKAHCGCRSGVFLGQIYALLNRYHSLGLKILLIGEDSLRNAGWSFLADLCHPGIQILEGVPISYGVSKHYSSCALIISLSYGPVPFLTCCVPNLQLNTLSLHLNSPCLEVYTNSGHIVLFEAFTHKGKDEIGLTHTAIPDYYQLGQDVHAFFRLHYNFYVGNQHKAKHGSWV